MSREIIKCFRTINQVDVSAIRDFSRSTKDFFALLDYSKVASATQIRAALEHTRRHSGKRVRDDTAIFMMFMSGEPQISKAIGAVGVRSDSSSIVAVAVDSEDMERFASRFPDIREDNTLSIPEDSLVRDKEVFTNIVKVELRFF